MTTLNAVARRGFSLVELLTVIAVIGVLIALIIPTVGGIQANARKTQAKSNLRQIAIAYSQYANGGNRPRSINAATIYDWTRVLAQNVDFNQPDIYILGEDPLVEQAGDRVYPQVIATPPADGTGQWTVHPDFQGFPLSFAVANKLSSQASAASTPVAWTRGLSTSGTWNDLESANPGVYGNDGGHIAFLSGTVEFFSDVSAEGGQLIHYTSKNPTGSIKESLNPGAEGLDSNGKTF